ncbi:MAG: PD-(D/E)XK nuclease family protein [Bacteroidota bacterium]
MKILFSTLFDEPTYPVNIFMKYGIAAGCRHMGPAGLLSILELHLGVSKPSETNVLRVFKYRKALKQIVRGAFFEKSFSANELDVAEELLSWRDKLILAGWDFNREKKMPARLETLAKAEVLAGIADSFADRFRIVLSALKSGAKIPLKAFTYFEPLELLPPHIFELISLLEMNGIGCTHFLPPSIPPDESDLSSLRSFIFSLNKVGVNRSEAKGDGSLHLILLPDRLQAGDFLAGLIRNHDCCDTVVISENNEIQPFLMLRKDDFATPAINMSDPVPTGVSLLQLLTVFLWKPWQPRQLFEFLQCPVTLLPPHLSRLLAKAMSDKPGIGSEAWVKALATYRESIAEEERFNRTMERLNYLLEHEKFDTNKGAPSSTIIKLFEFATGILRGRYAKMTDGVDKSMLLPVLNSCANLLDILSLFEEKDVISELELQRIIEKSISSEQCCIAPRAAGSLPVISSPGNLAGFADTLIWYDFASGGTMGASFETLFPEERAWLEALGVILEPANLKSQRNSWLRKQFIRFVRKQLICIVPENFGGESSQPHPFRSFIDAHFKSVYKLTTRISGPETIKLSENLAASTTFLTFSGLPAPAAYWHVTRAEKLILDDYPLSYSGMNSLVESPFIWVLKYRARIKDEAILQLADDSRFMGNVSHRVFQYALTRPGVDVTLLDQPSLEKLYSKAVEHILQTEGMLLLEKGKEDRVQSLHHAIKEKFMALVKHISDNNWVVEGCEAQKEAVRSGLKLQGYADILLSRKKKGPKQYAIIDLKWQSGKYYSRLMNEDRDLQLALYSSLFNDVGGFSPTAYFIISTGRLYTRDQKAFKHGIHAGPDDWAAAYQQQLAKLFRTVEYRMGELKEGKIEMGEGISIEELEIFSLDPEQYLLPSGDEVKEPARFNDYSTFTNIE